MQIDSEWHPLFSSQEFITQHPTPTLAQYKLSVVDLKARMVQTLNIRKRFLESGVIHDKEAVEKDEEAGKQRKSSLVLLNRRYTRKSRYTPKVPAEDPE